MEDTAERPQIPQIQHLIKVIYIKLAIHYGPSLRHCSGLKAIIENYIKLQGLFSIKSWCCNDTLQSGELGGNRIYWPKPEY